MLRALLVLLRSIGLICRGHRAVALENLALRQQLAAHDEGLGRGEILRTARGHDGKATVRQAKRLAVCPVDLRLKLKVRFDPMRWRRVESSCLRSHP
jgi:hypothetical protein